MAENVEKQDVNNTTSDLPDESGQVSDEPQEDEVDSQSEDIDVPKEEAKSPEETLDKEYEDRSEEKKSEGVSTVSSSELSSLKEKLDKKSAQLLRLAADFDNFKKRQRRDTQLQVQNFAEKLMKGLLPVLDSMDRAKETVDDGEDIEHLREGFIQIFNQFHKALENAGISSMDVVGQPFDPRYHEALMHHPADGIEPGSVTVELQKGWKMGDRVLRAARVGVAPENPSDPDQEVEPVADEVQPELEIEIEDSDNECDGAEGDCDGADYESDSDKEDSDGAYDEGDESDEGLVNTDEDSESSDDDVETYNKGEN